MLASSNERDASEHQEMQGGATRDTRDVSDSGAHISSE